MSSPTAADSSGEALEESVRIFFVSNGLPWTSEIETFLLDYGCVTVELLKPWTLIPCLRLVEALGGRVL